MRKNPLIKTNRPKCFQNSVILEVVLSDFLKLHNVNESILQKTEGNHYHILQL